MAFGLFVGCAEDAKDKNVLPAEKAEVATEIVEKDGMVLVPGQTYRRGNEYNPGNDKMYREEAPPHMVTVSGFWIDKHEVTNAQFKEFVDATGYATFAEKSLSKEEFPNAPPEQLVPGATIFSPPSDDIDPWASDDAWRWWSYTAGACWKSPEGKGSSIKHRMDHPVVCLNANDAQAYAKWAGKRLPTEAEWELAARGGLKNAMFTWGNDPKPDEQWMANCFQEDSPPITRRRTDTRAPPPLVPFLRMDMDSTTWLETPGEICSDYYHPDYYASFTEEPHPDPKGPKNQSPMTSFNTSIVMEPAPCRWRESVSLPISMLQRRFLSLPLGLLP